MKIGVFLLMGMSFFLGFGNVEFCEGANQKTSNVRFVAVEDLPEEYQWEFEDPYGFGIFRDEYYRTRECMNDCCAAVLYAKRYLKSAQKNKKCDIVIQKAINIILYAMLRLGVDLETGRVPFCSPELYKEAFMRALMFDMYAIMINDVKIILKRLGLPTKGTVDSGEELDELLDKFENLENFILPERFEQYKSCSLHLYDEWFVDEIGDEERQQE